jgi:hypothetical protein
VGAVLEAEGAGGALAQAASASAAAREAMNRMGAKMPPGARRRNACHARHGALKRLNSKD